MERSYSLASSKIKVDKMPEREKTIGAKTIQEENEQIWRRKSVELGTCTF